MTPILEEQESFHGVSAQMSGYELRITHHLSSLAALLLVRHPYY